MSLPTETNNPLSTAQKAAALHVSIEAAADRAIDTVLSVDPMKAIKSAGIPDFMVKFLPENLSDIPYVLKLQIEGAREIILASVALSNELAVQCQNHQSKIKYMSNELKMLKDKIADMEAAKNA